MVTLTLSYFQSTYIWKNNFLFFHLLWAFRYTAFHKTIFSQSQETKNDCLHDFISSERSYFWWEHNVIWKAVTSCHLQETWIKLKCFLRHHHQISVLLPKRVTIIVVSFLSGQRPKLPQSTKTLLYPSSAVKSLSWSVLTSFSMW